MDWGSLVAATAVGGLIVLAVDGGARWYLRRRERRAKQAEAEYDRRTYIRVGGHIVATELRTNADVAKRFEAGNRAPSEGKAVSLTAWRERKSEIMGLRDQAPDLWDELEAAFEALAETKAEGVFPPSSADLLKLADRLDKAAEQRFLDVDQVVLGIGPRDGSPAAVPEPGGELPVRARIRRQPLPHRWDHRLIRPRSVKR